MKKLLLLAMAVAMVGCGKSKQLTELELKLDDAVERINVLEEVMQELANRPIPHRVDPTTGLPIGGGMGGAPAPMTDPLTGLPIAGPPKPKK